MSASRQGVEGDRSRAAAPFSQRLRNTIAGLWQNICQSVQDTVAAVPGICQNVFQAFQAALAGIRGQPGDDQPGGGQPGGDQPGGAQPGTQPPGGLPDWVIIMIGIHFFCGIALLSTPYAAKETGWHGLGFFVIFCGCAVFTSHLIGLCLENNPNISTYPGLGRAAFGTPGHYFVLIIATLFTYVSIRDSLMLRLYVLVVVTIVISIALPFYGPFMSLLGSLLGIMVAYIIPCICFLRIGRNLITPEKQWE